MYQGYSRIEYTGDEIGSNLQRNTIYRVSGKDPNGDFIVLWRESDGEEVRVTKEAWQHYIEDFNAIREVSDE